MASWECCRRGCSWPLITGLVGRVDGHGVRRKDADVAAAGLPHTLITDMVRAGKGALGEGAGGWVLRERCKAPGERSSRCRVAGRWWDTTRPFPTWWVHGVARVRGGGWAAREARANSVRRQGKAETGAGWWVGRARAWGQLQYLLLLRRWRRR